MLVRVRELGSPAQLEGASLGGHLIDKTWQSSAFNDATLKQWMHNTLPDIVLFQPSTYVIWSRRSDLEAVDYIKSD